MNGDQRNEDGLTQPAAATADSEAINCLVTSNDLPTNGVSQEVRENADQCANTSELGQLVQSLKLSDEKCVVKGLKKNNKLKDIDVTEFFHVDSYSKRVKDVAGLFKRLNLDYSDPSEWILYIIYQQKYKALDCFLMHQSGQKSVVFIKASKVDDPFEFLKQALEASSYEEHQWLIMGDFCKKLFEYFFHKKYPYPAEQADARN